MIYLLPLNLICLTLVKVLNEGASTEHTSLCFSKSKMFDCYNRWTCFSVSLAVTSYIVHLNVWYRDHISLKLKFKPENMKTIHIFIIIIIIINMSTCRKMGGGASSFNFMWAKFFVYMELASLSECFSKNKFK